MKRKNRSQSRYLTYLWIFAVGITVLYSFSLLPRPTGFASATSSPSAQTPSECEKYALADDLYCDDAKEVCNPDKYVEGTSLVACHECTTGQWKQPKWCKGVVAMTTVPQKPNLYVKSHEILPDYWGSVDATTKTGIYAVSSGYGPCGYGPVPCYHISFYEIHEDGSIVKDMEGRGNGISTFDIVFIVSNDGKPTLDEFVVELQKLKKDSSGWSKVQSKTVVLTEPSREIEFALKPGVLNQDKPKFRLVVDTKDKIKESNEDDNQDVFDFPIRKI